MTFLCVFHVDRVWTSTRGRGVRPMWTGGTFCPYDFVCTILSNTILSGHPPLHAVHRPVENSAETPYLILNMPVTTSLLYVSKTASNHEQSYTVSSYTGCQLNQAFGHSDFSLCKQK